MKTVFRMTSKKRHFFQIKACLGAIFFKSKHIGHHFCSYFQGFWTDFQGFAKVFTDFAWIFRNFNQIKTLGGALAPPSPPTPLSVMHLATGWPSKSKSAIILGSTRIDDVWAALTNQLPERTTTKPITENGWEDVKAANTSFHLAAVSLATSEKNNCALTQHAWRLFLRNVLTRKRFQNKFSQFSLKTGMCLHFAQNFNLKDT